MSEPAGGLGPRALGGVVAVAVMASAFGSGFGERAAAQQPGGATRDSRAEDLVDSRELLLAAETVIRQGEAPAIDTSSQPDQEVVSLRTDVLFAFGSAELSAEAGRVVDEAARQIDALEPSRLLIVGHTDNVGSDTSNQALSEQRAAAVEGALRSRLGAGAPPSEVAGRGESEPVAPNNLPDGSDNPAGRALNRRVAVEVFS